MNIVRALDVALPELPERIIRKIPPPIAPGVVAKEHVEKGQVVVITKAPGSDLIFRFTPIQWKLIQIFDGVRTPAEIAEHFKNETGTEISEDEIKEFASYLQSESSLLYKSPIERNIALQQELRSSRLKRKKSQTIDFTDITIKVWNDADDYITWLYPRVKFLFTPWFVWTSLAMFAIMGWMWADRFGEVWNDSFAFYNFTTKSGRDIIEFWFLFGAMAAIHETAHGLTGKHFGAKVEKMGFTLMYFAPSFFCDASEVWIVGGKWARIATAIAGIWLDLVVCFLATIVWWGTPTGMLIHDWAYKVMMVTGIGVSILNLNPLIKLDGYIIFCELVAEPSLKETSTTYLSTWVRKHVFRLPVEVEYVPRRKRPFYVIYAILSGLYSYSLLSILMLLTYHILRSFSPEWAFVPALAAGYWVFRSRIKLLVKFMKTLYLDKKERIRAWFTPTRLAVSAAILLLALFIPVWPDFVRAPFVLAAPKRVRLHATVPGTVVSVSALEGQTVSAGTPLMQLRNLALESEVEQARAELSSGTARAVLASSRYMDFAAAEQDRRRLAQNERLLADMVQQLTVVSPISGTVLTPHAQDMVGHAFGEGDQLLEVADTSQLQARIYLPEFSIHELQLGDPVRLLLPGKILPISGTLNWISATSELIVEGLIPKEQLQGINPPHFYVGTALLWNTGDFRDGASGSAKVLVKRRSIAGFLFNFGSELVQRKIW
jgi:putative peptide zinc metalloprotease protein